MKLSLAAILVAALTLLREAGCFRISGDFGDNAIDMKVEMSSVLSDLREQAEMWSASGEGRSRQKRQVLLETGSPGMTVFKEALVKVGEFIAFSLVEFTIQ